MTQRFENPLVKFTSDILQTLPGATLTFAVSGSSTAKAVYADKSKVTSLGSVVTADSAGIFVPIWLDGTYRATLKNSAGIVQTGWPIDNIGDNQNFTAYAAWDATFTYDITTNTFVTGEDGNYYKSIQNPNFNKNPVTRADYWERVYILSEWNPNRNYLTNVLVVNDGLLYKSNTTPNLNHEPPNLSFWDNVSFNASITGPFTATGTITGNALVSTTSTTTATLVASGAITGASVAVTGAATAATVTTTGTTSANALASTTSVTAATVTASGLATAGGYRGPGATMAAKKVVNTDRISTTTTTADPELTIALTPSGTTYYAFKAVLFWDGQGSTANGISAYVNSTSGSPVNIYIASTNATSANADPTANSSPNGGIFSILPSAASANDWLIIEGYISATGNGNIFVQWAQKVSTAANTRLKVGSFLTVTQL